VAIVSGARAQDAITLDNFESRFFRPPMPKDMVAEPSKCKLGGAGATQVCTFKVYLKTASAEINVRETQERAP
jgi:hypothetical protein